MSDLSLSTIDPTMYGPPSSFIDNVTHFAKQVYNFIKYDKPIYLDLSDKYLRNVNKESKVNAVLANDFVETKYKNNIRKAKDFKHTTDTLIGDKRIKLSNISKFYGIENGKLKINTLDKFDDETVIMPVRNPTRNKIKKVIIRDFHPQYIDTNNDTISVYDLRLPDEDKIIFSDENGNAIFVNDLRKKHVMDKLNKSLETINRYPILLDNGRYEHYDLEGDVDSYVMPFSDKNDMFIIGY